LIREHHVAVDKGMEVWQAELTFIPFLDIQNKYFGYHK